MEKIRVEDIQDLVQYEKNRPAFRRRVVDLKKNRRLSVGDIMTLVFENRDTVLFQIQEMIRVERLVHPDAIRHEVETYNVLIPDAGELSATMLIEIQDLRTIKTVLDSLVGLPHDCVRLACGGESVPAVFDEGQSGESRISAVQYIKFPLKGRLRELFLDPATPAVVRVEHPRYRHTAPVDGGLRASLIADLRS